MIVSLPSPTPMPMPPTRPVRRPRCGWLVALAAGITVGCSPFDAPLDDDLGLLVDESLAPIDPAGVALGPYDAVPLDEATRDFVDDEIERSRASAPNEADGDEATAARDTILALPLDDLRATVLRNNLDLRVVTYDPEIAEERLNAERAKFDATFVVDASYLDADLPPGNSELLGVTSGNPALSGATGIFTPLAQDRQLFEAGLGIDVPLPTGGRIGLRQDFEIDDKTAEGLGTRENRTALSFSVSQPLLRGMGVEVNAASIRLARLDLGRQSAETKLKVIRVLASAEKAYWRLYAARKILEVQQGQLQLAVENERLVSALIEAGDAPPVERYGAELAIAQQLEALVVAETNVRIRARELSRVLNRDDLPIAEPMDIETTTEPRLERFALDANDLAARALEERLELLELELALASDAIRIGLARNAALPVFVVDFEFGLADRAGSIGDALEGTYSFDHPSFSVGARAAIPITNDAAEADLRRAMLSRLQRLATREQRRLTVRQQVYDAVDVLEQNWRRILAARQNVIAAAENYEAEQTLFSEGLRTTQDTLFALRQLGEARQREVAVIVAYQVAQIDLAFATGVLLGYAGTELVADEA
jgi:outer membrane protein TolC